MSNHVYTSLNVEKDHHPLRDFFVAWDMASGKQKLVASRNRFRFTWICNWHETIWYL